MTALAKLLHLGHTSFLTNKEGREYAWKEERDHGYSRDVETPAARRE
jgi:hypothetical protein